MNTISSLNALMLLFAIHSFSRAEEYTQRVILVPPEKLGFATNPNADPFSNMSPNYLSPAKPLRERLQEQTGMKFPDDSKIFYDIDSRALSVSSTEGVANALARAFQATEPPNIIVELRTYESRQPEIAAGPISSPVVDHATIVSRDQFLTFSGQTGSLRIKAPDSLTKSGGLTFQVTPIVSDMVDSVQAEIVLAEDVPALAPAQSASSGKSILLQTMLLLKFNTMTSLYEHQLPSGGYFGIAVRLTFIPGNLKQTQKADVEAPEEPESPER
jgi:hypothetical protein